MATFSTNQARQFYVVHGVKPFKGNAEYYSDHLDDSDGVGTLAIQSNIPNFINVAYNNQIYFEYKGATGEITRSDLIDIDKITYIKISDTSKLCTPHTMSTIRLNSEVNQGLPIAGQDYILRIAFKNYIGISDEDHYFKYGMVHAYSGMTASRFYATLAVSLFKNFSREVSNVMGFVLDAEDSDDRVEITASSTVDSLMALETDFTGVLMMDLPQEWILGVMPERELNYTAQPSTVTFNGDEVIWGTVESEVIYDEDSVNRKIADMEYFYMGERGDQYRNIGWPHVIKTNYVTNLGNVYNEIIDIHYYYEGPNEGSQKSEKDITFVITSDVSDETFRQLFAKIPAYISSIPGNN